MLDSHSSETNSLIRCVFMEIHGFRMACCAMLRERAACVNGRMRRGSKPRAAFRPIGAATLDSEPAP